MWFLLLNPPFSPAILIACISTLIPKIPWWIRDLIPGISCISIQLLPRIPTLIPRIPIPFLTFPPLFSAFLSFRFPIP